MKSLSLVCALGAAWLVLNVRITAAPPPFPSAFDPAAIDAFLSSQVREKELVGLSVAIVRNGQIEFMRGYGKSSLESGAPVGTNTMFAIGSVTKQFTSACILLLAEEGKLTVADKVARYYPGLTRAGDITLLDLMHHTSGYPDYYPLDFVDRRMAKPVAEDELITEFAGGKLDFEPGTRWSYSNTGFVILGRIVEKVSGQPFGRYLEARVLKPLGMAHTTYDPESLRGDLARGYASFALGLPEAMHPEGRGWIAAAGAIYSTATDLARWNLALMDGKLLKPESYQLLTTPGALKDGRTTDYGCGLAVQRRQGWTVLAHNGAVSGFAAASSFVPAARSSVVLLANTEFGIGDLQARILSLLLQSKRDLPRIAGLGAVEAARDFFTRLQTGRIDRTQLGEEFSHFMDAEKTRAAAARLRTLGKPVAVEAENLSERGGMEVANIRFKFKSKTVRGLMYRSTDGRIQQFLVLKE